MHNNNNNKPFYFSNLKHLQEKYKLKQIKQNTTQNGKKN